MEIERLVEYLREQIDLHVRSGYGSESEVLRRIEDQVSDELRNTDGAPVDGLLAEARAGLQAQRERESTWVEPTVNDRIDAAFDALTERGVVARCVSSAATWRTNSGAELAEDRTRDQGAQPTPTRTLSKRVVYVSLQRPVQPVWK